MGIMDRIVEAANAVAPKKDGDKPGLVDGVIDLVKNKGVSGILDEFKTKGLEDIASSWIGKGPNKPISTDQIKAALGSEKLQKIATAAGVSEENASKFLKEVLPNLIDKLTPEGKVPPEDDASKS